MPFAIAQGPAYVMAGMQKVCSDYHDFFFFPVDDVLMHDLTGKDHPRQLKGIFERFHDPFK